MEEILKFDTISQYNTFNRNETLHPLVSVVICLKLHQDR